MFPFTFFLKPHSRTLFHGFERETTGERSMGWLSPRSHTRDGPTPSVMGTAPLLLSHTGQGSCFPSTSKETGV